MHCKFFWHFLVRLPEFELPVVRDVIIHAVYNSLVPVYHLLHIIARYNDSS